MTMAIVPQEAILSVRDFLKRYVLRVLGYPMWFFEREDGRGFHIWYGCTDAWCEEVLFLREVKYECFALYYKSWVLESPS